MSLVLTEFAGCSGDAFARAIVCFLPPAAIDQPPSDTPSSTTTPTVDSLLSTSLRAASRRDIRNTFVVCFVFVVVIIRFAKE